MRNNWSYLKMEKKINAEIFNPDFLKDKKNSLYICAAGFENRTLGIVNQLKGKSFAHSLIFEYTTQKEDNEPNLKIMKNSLKELSDKEPLISPVEADNPLATQQYLVERLKSIPKENITHVFIDISGMMNALILQTLSDVNRLFWDKTLYVLYTEADNYYPTKKEGKEIYNIIKKKDIEKFGTNFSSSGVKETFILPDFKGKFKDYLPICLIFFVGYEPIRSRGLIEQYCPNLVIVCYGESPHNKFKWRSDFSRKIHKEVFRNYPHIDSKNINNEDLSTFEITDILKKLERIYSSFYENYNICITPQCSKLQAVAAYLFTLTYPDVQILFCLPGSFNPKRYSKGIGTSYVIKMFT
jgi:hypothetical protein